MIQKLYVKDYILIDEVDLSFDNGFSVFTGETGAGKSIFIDCVSILIGERLNTSMIRNGAKKTVIEGTFDLNETNRELLRENGYKCDCLTVTREISTDGKSSTRVNGKNASVSFVRSLLEDHIDIHSQRDNQYLLNDKYYLNLLDRFSGIQNELEELKEQYDAYRQAARKYRDLSENEYNEAQLDILRYQLNEIEKLQLKEGEEDDIKATLKHFDEREKLQEAHEKIRKLFSDDDGILSNLYEFTRMSSSLSEFSEISQNVENITNAYYAMSDDYDAIIDFLGNDDMDMNAVDELNSRLFEIQRIKRKYNSDVKAILQKAQDISNQLKSVENREEVLNELESEMNARYERYLKSAEKVSDIRKKKAIVLEKSVVSELKDLNLEKAVFKTDFERGKDSEKGFDKVTFLISMNPGQPLRELSKVASGGELSRLMLGLKTVFASLQGTELVIFDEIDTGVSGYTAFNIGLKMHQISEKMQVFAVTHLASVAAHGDTHYHITKMDDSDITTTEVTRLDKAQRISELAVISSSNLTDASLKAAEELLEKASASHK
ncbi:MAG: DNA repair protein RecN [Erysipelotrichaceae bacterium]|nr:DNA repair protein RecN [Erysipelotrichaceae bacterium]